MSRWPRIRLRGVAEGAGRYRVTAHDGHPEEHVRTASLSFEVYFHVPARSGGLVQYLRAHSI